MAQAHSPLPASNPSVEQVAGQIQAMIAERAEERLRKAPTVEPTPEPSLKPREPGIYFNLPAAEYHADFSLGSSDLKRLLQAPAVYWFHSHMNPERQPTPDSAAKQKGRALHKLVLEGEDAFASTFAVEPSPAGYPGALVTADDLKAKCRELGEPISGTKAELAKRIKAKDAKALIFDDILATFRVMVERDGMEVLKRDCRSMGTPTKEPQ
jgi:SAP domain